MPVCWRRVSTCCRDRCREKSSSLPPQHQLACIGSLQQVQAAQQGTLAAAGGTDQGRHRCRRPSPAPPLRARACPANCFSMPLNPDHGATSRVSLWVNRAPAVLQQAESRAEHQVDEGRLDAEKERLIGDGGEALGRLKQLGHGHRRRQRGVFDQEMKVLERGGTAMRAACGRITRPWTWGQFMPMAWAASTALSGSPPGWRGWSPSVGADVEGEADDGGGEGIQHYAGARQTVKIRKSCTSSGVPNKPDIEADQGHQGTGHIIWPAPPTNRARFPARR